MLAEEIEPSASAAATVEHIDSSVPMTLRNNVTNDVSNERFGRGAVVEMGRIDATIDQLVETLFLLFELIKSHEGISFACFARRSNEDVVFKPKNRRTLRN